LQEYNLQDPPYVSPLITMVYNLLNPHLTRGNLTNSKLYIQDLKLWWY